MSINIEICEETIVVSNKETGTRFDLKLSGGEDDFPLIVEDVHSEAFDLIENLKPGDFPKGLTLYTTERAGDRRFSWIDLSRGINSNRLLIDVTLSIHYMDWAQPFTIGEFSEAFVKEVTHNGYTASLDDSDFGSTYIHINTDAESNKLIATEISRVVEHAKLSYETTVFKLSKKIQDQLLVKVFNFPPHYQFVCTQYLVWFGELLSELGIKAHLQAEQNGTQTKFIVAPEDSPEMLSEIEKLFHLYLTLPYSELLPSNKSTPYEKAVVSNLQAQIINFQSQVQLKDSIIELKNETITSLQNKLETQSQRLMLIESMDSEINLLDGALSIGNIQWGPIKINPKLLMEKFK
ncbi:hypothetical protein G3U99_24370 [Vibrio coralliilyticus OCN008]|uniref:hypothetical protein n=1 Tax=Vibrio coralliilyticus TaxID=190893 RepID=UPI000390DB9A|nr:hypothetical protein [Vibrio coralliilyticus]ERB66543.1 hypothetical protein N779_03990 [Vibrio coralliilyticus OCN008]QIJ87361.1 hypothetical protein G3U99_24370 [Vibrio coralliilyticus OCN008]